jgi:carbon monoxide dehydrogenase subunit G
VKVQLDKTFPMPGPPEIAWEFLQNIEAVASCMPGAKLTEKLGENHHKGTVTVRLGPATMSFRGEVKVQDIDPAVRSLRLLGKGTDSSGSSGVSMNLLARIDATDDGSSVLVGSSEVSLSGKAVAFGGRMMDAVADKILIQFADKFAAEVAALQEQRSGSAAAGAGAPNVAAPPARAGELNALALGWAVFKDWLRGLFTKKKT